MGCHLPQPQKGSAAPGGSFGQGSWIPKPGPGSACQQLVWNSGWGPCSCPVPGRPPARAAEPLGQHPTARKACWAGLVHPVGALRGVDQECRSASAEPQGCAEQVSPGMCLDCHAVHALQQASCYCGAVGWHQLSCQIGRVSAWVTHCPVSLSSWCSWRERLTWRSKVLDLRLCPEADGNCPQTLAAGQIQAVTCLLAGSVVCHQTEAASYPVNTAIKLCRTLGGVSRPVQMQAAKPLRMQTKV